MQTTAWIPFVSAWLIVIVAHAAKSKKSSSPVTLLNRNTLYAGPGKKQVFLLLCQSWHPDCTDFAPTWKKLAKHYKNDENIMIAQLECSVKLHEPLCEHDYRAQAYPALYYGESWALDRYTGPTDLESLQAFAAEHIKPACTPFKLDLCDEETKQIIEKYMAMSENELAFAKSKVDRKIDENERDWVDEEEAYRKKYVAMKATFEKKANQIKEEHYYKWIKAIKKMKDADSAASQSAE